MEVLYLLQYSSAEKLIFLQGFDYLKLHSLFKLARLRRGTNDLGQKNYFQPLKNTVKWGGGLFLNYTLHASR